MKMAFGSIPRLVIAAFVALARRLGMAVMEQPYKEDNREMNRQIRRHIDLVNNIQANHIPLDARVLDVGCGVGWLAERLYEMGFRRIACCDWLSPEKVSVAARERIAYTQIDLNADSLSAYPDSSKDLIVCSDVLEHLENPARMLRGFTRVLAPDGNIFITIPNTFNIFERLHILRHGNSSRYRSERRSDPFGHISMLPHWVLESLCDRAGLEIISNGGVLLVARPLLVPISKA